jgi:S-adenosylmethionine decarboxylase
MTKQLIVGFEIMKKRCCNFGLHLMIDGYQGEEKKLDNKKLVEKMLGELPGKLNMQIVMGPVVRHIKGNDKKDPGGYSGFVVIAESHISIHTFPARKFVSADVYTCTDVLNKKYVLSYFKKAFGLKSIEVNFVKRGTRYPLEDMPCK